ncbi:hypothetical protein L21_1930 [Methanoculleus chikugoensis]|jgi:hypothetical protein|uniref:Uncharacterized protein n=1 Tax=Methanoculleus chikugoensis TaxID=118126 RepID=A0A1M4MM79_9EURY|nr:hypothetical protein [Methanoculleus chikugoensis]MDD4567999.1 hypothetical protein [Methanoculleus chikugoensis]NMA11405.1 hypothetical protein [Methanomicrobiales archaeon]SCL76009.1 hypothetical protein L21_1930 [Methanoculleus chikugoensis]
MKQDRWKLYLKVSWGAVIALLAFSLLVGWMGGSDSWNSMLAGSVWIIINFGILTLLIIIAVRIKEWIEGQVANVAEQKGAGAELQMLRQSVERIEAKVDRIEKVLDGISE